MEINEKTSVKLTIAKFVAAIVLVAGLIPWLQAQTRAIVRQEMEGQVLLQLEGKEQWKRWESENKEDQERFAVIRETLAQILTELKYLRPLVGR